MSYFMPYFDNLMKKLLLLAKNLSSQNWLSTKNSLSGAVTSMAVKDQLNIFCSFLQFFVSNFLQISYFMIYFDILIKNGQSVRREMGTAKIRFLLTKSISQSFLNFLISNFHKMSYFMSYFYNLSVFLYLYDTAGWLFFPWRINKFVQSLKMIILTFITDCIITQSLTDNSSKKYCKTSVKNIILWFFNY